MEKLQYILRDGKYPFRTLAIQFLPQEKVLVSQ